MMNKFCLALVFSFVFFNFTFASQSSGTIVSSTYSTSLVCADASCTPSLGSRINWKPTLGTGMSQVTIDDTTGVSGNIWGEKLGWINLKPTNYGLSINSTTGAISGYAWSQIGGWINFSPTNYGVSIDSSGQFTGYAWASGDNGGWIKFDCSGGATTTCVKTDWVPISARTASTPASSGGGGGGGGSVVANSNIYLNQSGKQNQSSDYSNDFRADMNDDGLVDIFDFNSLILNWGKVVTIDITLPKQDRCKAANKSDINCDGGVDVLDFNLLMIYWGQYIGAEGKNLQLK